MDGPLILIGDVRISQKSQGHPVVLQAAAGSMIEMSTSHPIVLVFISDANAVVENGGPTTDYRYKIAFNVAGERESLRNIAFQGYASAMGYYVFHN